MKNIFKEIYQNTDAQAALNKLLHSTLSAYNGYGYAGSGLISTYMVKESEISLIKETNFFLNCSLQTRFALYNEEEIVQSLDEITIACTMYVTANGNRFMNFLLYSNLGYIIKSYEIGSTEAKWQTVYDYFKNKIRNDKFRNVDKMCLSVMIGHF